MIGHPWLAGVAIATVLFAGAGVCLFIAGLPGWIPARWHKATPRPDRPATPPSTQDTGQALDFAAGFEDIARRYPGLDSRLDRIADRHKEQTS